MLRAGSAGIPAGRDAGVPALALGRVINPLHHPHHPRQLAVSQVRSRGQTEAVGKQCLGNLPPHRFTLRKDWLTVHRLPDGAGFDVFGFEREAHLRGNRP